MVFWWGWCGTCNCAFLECPKCNNNSCNAGHGTIRIIEGVSYVYPDAKFRELRDKIGEAGISEEACDVCWLADQYLELAYLSGEYPKNRKQIDFYNNRILERLGVSADGEIVNKKGKV
jgi:hypothetical protein